MRATCEMEEKTEQIRQLTACLLEKYGSSDIVITDYWDGDATAIGLSDKTRRYTAYITDNGNKNKLFFVSLENPPTSAKLPYTQGEEFNEVTAIEVEEIILKHFGISKVPDIDNKH